MAIVYGNDVNLFVFKEDTYYAIGCGENCTLTTVTEIAERTTADSGIWKQYKALGISGELTVDGVISVGGDLTMQELHEKQLDLETIVWQFVVNDENGLLQTSYSGNAIIANFEQTGTVESAAKFRINLVIDGEITVT